MPRRIRLGESWATERPWTLVCRASFLKRFTGLPVSADLMIIWAYWLIIKLMPGSPACAEASGFGGQGKCDCCLVVNKFIVAFLLSGMKGQVMLITVLALSGTMLGATAIAGLLMTYQIRQTTDLINSHKAIYAADAGIEWRLYRFFKVDNLTCNPACDGTGSESCSPPKMSNIDVPSGPLKTVCQTDNGITTIKSNGNSRKSTRAFEIILQ